MISGSTIGVKSGTWVDIDAWDSPAESSMLLSQLVANVHCLEGSEGNLPPVTWIIREVERLRARTMRHVYVSRRARITCVIQGYGAVLVPAKQHPHGGMGPPTWTAPATTTTPYPSENVILLHDEGGQI